MSEDPIEAIEQVADVIKEGVQFGGGNVISGWLHNATKTEIIEWLAGNVLSRVVNALERTREALSNKRNMSSKRKEAYEIRKMHLVTPMAKLFQEALASDLDYEADQEELAAASEKWGDNDDKYLKSVLWHLCNSISNGGGQESRSDLTEWLKGLKRRINASEVKRNCDRFNSGDVKKDAQDALEAYLEAGCCGHRAVAEYLLSPVKEENNGNRHYH